MLTIAFISQNVSDKIIRAYAIREYEGDLDKDRARLYLAMLRRLWDFSSRSKFATKKLAK